MIKVYKTILRPVADYLCVFYHSILTDEQDEQLERLQAQALKCIFGWKVPYAEMRSMAGVSTLRQRRIEMTDKFAENLVRVAPDCNRSYCEDSFSGYSGSV